MPPQQGEARPESTSTAPRRSAILLASLLATLLLVGSIWDLDISKALFDEGSGFGAALAGFGESPAWLALVVAGVLLVVARRRDHRAIGVLQIVAGAALGSLGVAAASLMPARYLDLTPAVLVVIGLATCAAAGCFAVWAAKGADRAATVRVALLLFAVVLAEMILVNVVKVVWDRPRMRFLAEHGPVAFQSWFVVGNDAREALIAAGTDGEEFKSFPSGHTANAATLMLLTLVAQLRATMRRHAAALLWVGAAWGLLVGLSRVVAGAHFVSDITIGFTITFALVLVAVRATRRSAIEEPSIPERIAA